MTYKKYKIEEYLPSEELSNPSLINWDEVNEFYRWQLIKRNQNYIDFYNEMINKTKEERDFHCFEKWKIEPLADPEELFPHFSSPKYLYDNFIDIGKYSYHKIQNALETDGPRTLISDVSSALNYLTTEVQISEEHDNRFLIMAFDLSKLFRTENQKNLIHYIQTTQNSYKDLERPTPKKTIDEVEKNLFVYDYVITKGYLGIEEEFLKQFGAKCDRSTFIKRFNTIEKHVSRPNDVRFNLNAIT